MNFLLFLTLFGSLINAVDIPHFDIGPEDYEKAFGHDNKKVKRAADCYRFLRPHVPARARNAICFSEEDVE